MCNLSRSWYVKKAKTDRDLSAKHEGQWLDLQSSERTEEERRQHTFCDKSDNQ